MPADFAFSLVTKYCETCGKALILHNNRDIQRKRFCSKLCLGKWMVSQGLLTNDYSLETREKMRQSKIDLLKTGWLPTGWRKYLPHRRIAGRGYVFIGQKREHQVVMEKVLGRLLGKGEVVHHIDGNKTNNDIGNLRLMTNSEHMKYHTSQRRLSYVSASI